ncbi:3-hydroxyacyl-CoA dehydrogenase family protein [Chloroflexota bacterium]
MEIRNISVLGAGVMGHGIAQICAQSGYAVNLWDITDDLSQKGLERIKTFLAEGVSRNKVTQEQVDVALSRINITADLAKATESADLVIEAIVENLNIKKDTFGKIDQICPAYTIFASNTSYISITDMATSTKRRDRFIGMHWFNPPQIMRLIEIVRGVETSDETVSAIVAVSKKIGKTPAVCHDSPGFIVNRILHPWFNEGIKLLEEGVASAEDIDTAIKVGGGFRMGPLELIDLVGLDIRLNGTMTIYEALKNEKNKPPQILIKKVQAGHLGRKTKKGFYDYE